MFDIICILIVIAGLVFGLKRGFLAQAGSVLGVIVGIVCCNLFAGRVAEHFIDESDGFDTILLTTVMSYVVIFVAAYLGGRLVGILLKTAFKAMHLGMVDRLGGVLFAIFEFMLMFSILLNTFIGIFPSTELRTEYTGVKRVVINLAPTVLGCSTVGDVLDSVTSAVESVAMPEASSQSDETADRGRTSDI